MGIVKVDLAPRFKRPVISMETDAGRLNVVIDTGATKSVWNNTSDNLKMYFPNAKRTKYKTKVSGFGGTSNKLREIWEIPVFDLTDKNDANAKYTIHNLLVVVIDDETFGFDIVLACTMFKKTNYGILNTGRNANTFVISNRNRDFYCTIDGKDKEGNVIKFTSFLQDALDEAEKESPHKDKPFLELFLDEPQN